jgi:hypothetical protein
MNNSIYTLEDFIEVCTAKENSTRIKAINHLTERNLDSNLYDKVWKEQPSCLLVEGSAYYLRRVQKANDTLRIIKEKYK